MSKFTSKTLQISIKCFPNFVSFSDFVSRSADSYIKVLKSYFNDYTRLFLF